MTLRELSAVAEARMEYDWSHTSSQLCLLANCNRDPKAAPYSPRDFNPMLPPRKRPTVPVSFLKDVWPAASSRPQ